MPQIAYLVLGLITGVLSGIFGIGGGTILIPAFIFFFGLTQHQAQGTSLAVMLPPVFLLAVWRYYREGHVVVPMVFWGALGLTIGALLGAHFVQAVPDANLKRAFGIYLVLIGLQMAFFK